MRGRAGGVGVRGRAEGVRGRSHIGMGAVMPAVTTPTFLSFFYLICYLKL